jgi:hypothetical protein
MYVYIHICVCVYRYIYIHTHKHTYIFCWYTSVVFDDVTKTEQTDVLSNDQSVYINTRPYWSCLCLCRHSIMWAMTRIDPVCLFTYSFPSYSPSRYRAKFFHVSTPYRLSLSATCFAVVQSHTFKDSPWEIIWNHNFAGYARCALIKFWRGSVVDTSGLGLGCRYNDGLQAERFGFRTLLEVSYFLFSKLSRPGLEPIQSTLKTGAFHWW